jgi:hypothetical protein
MTVLDLMTYLGFPEVGVLELRTANGLGYFDDVKAAAQAAKSDGDAVLSPHIFASEHVTNQTSPWIKKVQPHLFGAAVYQFHYEDDLDPTVDTRRLAEVLAKEAQTTYVWMVPAPQGTAYGYVSIAVQPFPWPAQAELDNGLNVLKANLQSTFGRAGFDEALWLPAAGIPLSLGTCVKHRGRALSQPTRRQLYRPLPLRVEKKLSVVGSKLTKMFQSRGRVDLGVDEKGHPIPATEENFDRKTVELMVAAKENFTEDEIVDTLWNRPNCAIRANGGGLKEILDFVKDVTEEVGQKRENRPRAPARPVPEFGPTDTLREHLYGLYHAISESTGGYVQRSDVEVSYKAEVVLRYLIDQAADFYFFAGSNETVFVLNGHPYVVDTAEDDYQNWFVQHVEIFTASSPRGKELTQALRTKIQAWPRTNKAEAHWGRYDKKTEVLYLCFDPKHTQVIRVEPAGDDRKPRVEAQDNGAGGITLRGMHHRKKQVDVVPTALQSEGWTLFRREVHDGQALPDGTGSEPNYRLMSTVFNLCCMLPLHRHRPLKFHYGTQGSGKTAAAFDWATVLYGSPGSGGGEYDDKKNLLSDMSTGGPFTIQDNAESKDRYRFGQVYLVPASGKPTKIRKYYTEAGERVFLPNGSLTLTAIEGMHRPEELRRTFEFGFDSAFWTTKGRADFTTREDLLDEKADAMLSAVLELFSVYILPNFEARYREAIVWLDEKCGHLYGSKKDYSDWLGRMLAITEAVGHLLVDEEDFDARVTFMEWMNACFEQDSASAVNDDPTMTMLVNLRNRAIVIKEDRSRRPGGDEGDSVFVHTVRVRFKARAIEIGPFTVSQLHDTVGWLAKGSGSWQETRSSKALLGRIRALVRQPVFSQLGWHFESVGHDRSANAGQYMLTYTPPGQPVETDPEDSGDDSGDVIAKINE